LHKITLFDREIIPMAGKVDLVRLLETAQAQNN